MILAVDPGIANVGWALMRKNEVIDYDVIRTRPNQLFHRRLKKIKSELQELVDKFYIRTLVIEEFSFGRGVGIRNQKSMIDIAKAHGVIQSLPCRIVIYHANKIVKRQIKRDREKRKKDSVLYVNKRHNLDLKFRQHHIADAIMLGDHYYGQKKKEGNRKRKRKTSSIKNKND